jgi:hypothetical protein
LSCGEARETLMVFYQGPPQMPHRAECSFRGGWPARALRDAGELAMKRVPAAILVLGSTAVLGVDMATSPKDSYPQRLLVAVLVIVVGFALGLFILAITALTPWGRNRHWRLKITTLGKEDEPESHSFLTIQSEHWHRVRNVECAVTAPDGTTHVARETENWLNRDMNLGPGMSVHRIYPSGFGVPPPVIPGKYKVRWTTEERPNKRRTLRRGTWKVV